MNPILSKKIIIAIVVVFVFLAGLIFSVGNYYKNGGQVAGVTDEKVEVEITNATEYKAQVKNLFQGYLILSSAEELLSPGFLEQTATIKEQLLAKRVSADLMATHSQIVIKLIDIERAVATQDVNSVLSIFADLRNLISNF